MIPSNPSTASSCSTSRSCSARSVASHPTAGYATTIPSSLPNVRRNPRYATSAGSSRTNQTPRLLSGRNPAAATSSGRRSSSPSASMAPGRRAPQRMERVIRGGVVMGRARRRCCRPTRSKAIRRDHRRAAQRPGETPRLERQPKPVRSGEVHRSVWEWGEVRIAIFGSAAYRPSTTSILARICLRRFGANSPSDVVLAAGRGRALVALSCIVTRLFGPG